MAIKTRDGMTRREHVMVDVSKLFISDDADFRDKASIDDNVAHLKSLIKANGFDSACPIVIHIDKSSDKYEVVDGRCRTRAVQELLKEGEDMPSSIPALLEDRYASPEERLFKSYIRNTGKPFTPIEKAKLFAELHRKGWTQTEIAKRLNVSLSSVGQLLMLASTDVQTQALVASGQVAANTVIAAVRNHGARRAGEAVQAAVAQTRGKGASAEAVALAASGNASETGTDPTPKRSREGGKQTELKLLELRTKFSSDIKQTTFSVEKAINELRGDKPDAAFATLEYLLHELRMINF